jgi:hypothetical protein
MISLTVLSSVALRDISLLLQQNTNMLPWTHEVAIIVAIRVIPRILLIVIFAQINTNVKLLQINFGGLL